MSFSIGIVGYGYWGPNLARNFSGSHGSSLAYVCDAQPDRLKKVKAQYPTCNTTSDYEQLLNDPDLDAIAIATPVTTHFDLSLRALKAGKHVWIEKPLAATVAQAEILVETALMHNRCLFVDHTFIYTSAIRKIKEMIVNGSIGDIYYFDSVRANLGLFQSDVSVIYDLAVHDLSIMDYLLPVQPSFVSAMAVRNVPQQPYNIAYLTLGFDLPLIAHIHVNWLAPVKIRRTLIGGSQKMIVYDDVEASEKVKVYDKGIMVQDDPESRHQRHVGYRTGDMVAPQLSVSEALSIATEHFIKCAVTGTSPITDGYSGLRIVRILEAANQSASQQGKPVLL